MKRSPAHAARRLATAYRLQPRECDARRAVDALIATGFLEEARDICARQVEMGDALGYWRHHASYVDDLEELAEKRRSGDGTMRIVLFNDTDGRTNIGCRLTSQNLKSAIATTFPNAAIHSLGFRFSAYRQTEKSSVQGDVTKVRKELERLIEVGYGPRSVDVLLGAELVILQPEGSVDENVSLQGLLTFFSPLLLAALLGKRTAILNGTIPAYGDARRHFLKSIFALVDMVAARDEISADTYSIRFLPDAALLHVPPTFAGERDSCLITTGARNSAGLDRLICAKALEICREFHLRPVVLTRASSRLQEFTPQITELNGIFAETAGLLEAAETVSRCRLHIGARYHMAILGLVCGVPSVLFNVRTRKNEWLARLSPLIVLASFENPLSPLARQLLPSAGEYPEPRDALREEYIDFLRKAGAAEKVDRVEAVAQLLDRLTHEGAGALEG
ncbi:MAG TPA: polysaccharide pyruvyl transferase family protein [Pseudaminobacter sp.]|nr:polysaccharide pyruvyl transferase family protein [Pseudaminobacter sp.]